MSEALTYLLANWESILSVVTGAIALAAAIAAMTPTPKDDGIIAAIRKVVDLVALNVKNAKNDPNAGK